MIRFSGRNFGWLTFVQVAIFAVAAYVAFFFELSRLPINLWDEARLAVNALEMTRSGDPIVTRYLGEPDLWNTKPPLMIWLMSAGISVFGFSELVVRIPSAVAGLLTALVVAAFTRRVTGHNWAALLAGLTLMGTAGFVTNHVTRTGDYDALLTLFTTSGAIAAWMALEPDRGLDRKWVLAAGCALALALMTKGVAALLVVPGVALYALYRNKGLTVVRSPAVWMVAILALTPLALFYLVREAALPGYLSAVWQNELGGRYASFADGHERPWRHYLVEVLRPLSAKHLSNPHTTSAFPWALLAPVAVWVTLRWSPDLRVRRAAVFSALVVVTHLVILTSAATRYTWYAAPEMPFFAILIGCAAGGVWRAGSTAPGWFRRLASLPVAISMALFMVGVVVAYNAAVVRLAANSRELRGSAFVSNVLHTNPRLRNVRIISDGYDEVLGRPYHGPEAFYADLWKQRDVGIVPSGYIPKAGETVLWCNVAAPTPPKLAGTIIASTANCRAITTPS